MSTVNSAAFLSDLTKSYLECRLYVLVTTEPAMYYVFGMLFNLLALEFYI